MWSISPFISLYESIEVGELDNALFDELLEDLKLLNLNRKWRRNPSKRQKLESGDIELSDGNSYKLNQAFTIDMLKVSDELDLDEIVCAEIILTSEDSSANIDQNLCLFNKGILFYYLRRQYILQIVSYVINSLRPSDNLFKKLLGTNEILIDDVIEGFNSIHQELDEINTLVNKAQILDNFDVLFQQRVKVRRDFLVKEYDILATILYGLAKNGILSNKDALNKVIMQASSLDSGDFFVVFYLPALLSTLGNLEKFSESDVELLHSNFIKDLHSEAIYSKPIKVVTIFIFLTFFIGWCKGNPTKRAKKFDFTIAVDIPMTTAVELGAIEQLMVYAADTSIVESDTSMELFFDIRSLLEKHLPRLTSKRLLNPEYSSGIGNKAEPIFTSEYTNLSIFNYSLPIFLSSFHEFLQAFITDCAFLLTKIKNAEEDSLLSGEDLYLDDISAKADLERFFITVYFFYASRPELSQAFWSDKESNLYGFIEWAAKCSDIIMKSCFYLMVSSLSYGSEGSTDVFHYIGNNQNISWKRIAVDIANSVQNISALEKKIHELQQNGAEKNEINNVAIQSGLNEETIILLSSYMTLIQSVAHDVDEDIKKLLSDAFMDVLFELPKVRTPLFGAALKVLSNLVPQDETSRYTFWTRLDRLIFQSYHLDFSDSSYVSAFDSVFTAFSEVSGFLQLFSRLVKIGTKNHNDLYMKFGKLSFPINLGSGYRKIGIWPYYEYILNSVLLNAKKIQNETQRQYIYGLILRIVKSSLLSFDYSVIINSVITGSNLDAFVPGADFFSFVQQSNASATMNYLYDEKIFSTIFMIASVGSDSLEAEWNDTNKPKTQLVADSLYIIDLMFMHEGTYTEEFYPIIKRQPDPSVFIPKTLRVRGLRSFYDAIFFDLKLIAHFGLYVGSNDNEIVSSSISILKRLAIKFSTNAQDMQKNMLLTVLDAVDDSARIKQNFMDQLTRPIENDSSLALKIEILQFISSNLPHVEQDPTVSHFLLGYQVSNTLSLGPNLDTFIKSGSSLLHTIVTLLKDSLASLNAQNIDYAAMRLSSEFMEIIAKLCRNPLTSKLTLDYLSSLGLEKTLLELDLKISNLTKWSDFHFEGAFNNLNSQFMSSSPIGAVLFFLKYRGQFLQYLSLSLHFLSNSGQSAKCLEIIEALVSTSYHSATIFSFLDILGLVASAPTLDPLKKISFLSGIDLNLSKVEKNSSVTGCIYDFGSVLSLIDLKKRSQMLLGNTLVNEESAIEVADEETRIITKSISNYLSHHEFSKLQLSALHSWVQLVQIIVVDGKLNPILRSNLILEVFESIVPKVSDYINVRVSYSEELVSLAVFLYELYHEDRILIDNEKTVDSRLHVMFKTCIHGISTSSSTLRSDFYILGAKYLTRVLQEESLAKEVLQWLKFSNEKLIETVCNDAILGQGANQITGILFLDVLNQLASLSKVNFVLESLIKDNMLLLIIRSIKTVDEVLQAGNDSMSSYNVLYELTLFKCILHFLTKISQTKAGAHALVQNEIFQTISSCKFLQVDPDLGFQFLLEEYDFRNTKRVRANLDMHNPLGISSTGNGVSLFEIVIPVFQLIASILLSSGAANRPVFKEAKKVLAHFKQLIRGTLKRDALLEKDSNAIKPEGLDKFTKLIVLVCTFTGYDGEDAV